MTSPSQGTVKQGADAYIWARNFVSQPLIPLPQLSNPVSDGLDSGLDHIVKAALDATGMMDELEKVTGKLDVLTHAAQEWQSRAQTMQGVAKALRDGALVLSAEWEGSASDAFGTHMGAAVKAIDGTAADMATTAKLINQAAEECKLAEETVIEIIRETIKELALSLAAMVVTDIVTLGLATIVDALVADAEIAVFVGRVTRVSKDLGDSLRELMESVKEMRMLGTPIDKSLTAARQIQKLGGVASFGKSLSGLGKDPSLANVGKVVGVEGVKYYKGVIKGGIAMDTVNADPVGAIKDGLTSNTNKDAVSEQADGRPSAAPYRVPKGTVREVFG